MTLEFLGDATNVVLVGPNGVGKSMLAQNIAHQALIEGYTVLFTSAGQLLGDLAALDIDAALRRRLRHYVPPQLLMVDEVGYLSYSNRHADLMFELDKVAGAARSYVSNPALDLILQTSVESIVQHGAAYVVGIDHGARPGCRLQQKLTCSVEMSGVSVRVAKDMSAFKDNLSRRVCAASLSAPDVLAAQTFGQLPAPTH